MINYIKKQMNTLLKTIQKASNDGEFHTTRSRSAVIKSSMTQVEGLPKKLKIFRIAGSKFWQMRYFVQGKYITKSLKTVDLPEAMMCARYIYESLAAEGLGTQEKNEDNYPVGMKNQQLLHNLVEDILQSELEKVQRDEIRHNSYVMTKIRLEGLIFEFLKDKPLHKIDIQVLEDFIRHMTDKKLSASTMQGYIAQMRKILRLLERKKILSSVPSFPPLKAQPNSRGGFTVTEYKAILRKSKELRTQTFTDWGEGKRAWMRSAYHQMPMEINWLIRFMVYTFMRPGDVRQLKNQHIEIINGKYHYLRLTMPEIKRHKSATVSLAPAVPLFTHILAHQTAQGYGAPSDYVFFPEVKNRRLVLDIVGWCFNWILKELDLKQGPHGNDRTFYSLRHSAITFRLIYGGNIDLLTLARNARTSVEMIEKFYASTLSAEMNVSLLHSKRR